MVRKGEEKPSEGKKEKKILNNRGKGAVAAVKNFQ